MMWGNGWHGMGWGSMGWGGWLIMILIVVAVWAAVVVAGIAIFRSLRKRGTVTSPTQDAARILDERFARGEIDTDEYEARREALRTVR
jgi:putative membrane protein